MSRPMQIIIVGSVMFTFISYWRVAAIVLGDLASTMFYIGGIVESAIGKAAPWFILAVMLFSYCVRSLYIESCALFVRGGVYRIVKRAMGSFVAKIAVSALLFDYILTGPISSVSAGQYIIGWFLELLVIINPGWKIASPELTELIRRWGAMAIAIGITLYFFWQNVKGMHESSDKALKILVFTTIIALLMIGWALVTLWHEGPANELPATPDLHKKVDVDPHTGLSEPRINPYLKEQEDPLGFLGRFFPSFADQIREQAGWLSLIGVIGVLIAFGHSILSMSGYETLAQVYREVESPKLPNFKKAGLIIFFYVLIFTGGISFLAVLLIPDDVRLSVYKDNLLGGLAMHVMGPPMLKLILNFLVVIAGAVILSGAVNTSIIGANGVLNRVAEDGILPTWLQRPHRRYGTTARILFIVVFFQLVTILASQGDVILLGEAYAFGVVWSFVFNSASMLILRFKEKQSREYRVPLNFTIRGVELPVGLALICVVLLSAAVCNFLTKELATIGGLVFTGVFMLTFNVTDLYYRMKRRGKKHEHLEQFTQRASEELSVAGLQLNKQYRKLVAIRSPHNLQMLEKTLDETDPDTTDVVVMTAKQTGADEGPVGRPELDDYDQHLMTAVLQRAERSGKEIVPLIVPTNNPLHAIIQTAKELGAHELIMGASNKYTAEEQLDAVALYWINLHPGGQTPLTVRLRGKNWDVHLDLAGGYRIPKIHESKAKSVAELRAAGVGVNRVLLLHDGSPESNDLFQAVLTGLDPKVSLDVVEVLPDGQEANGMLAAARQRAEALDREIETHVLRGDVGPALVEHARKEKHDLLVIPVISSTAEDEAKALDERVQFFLRNAPCRVFLAAPAAIPRETE
jgi:amino acid transporter/nucleotide-binding universal stress UspA family protein